MDTVFLGMRGIFVVAQLWQELKDLNASLPNGVNKIEPKKNAKKRVDKDLLVAAVIEARKKLIEKVNDWLDYESRGRAKLHRTGSSTLLQGRQWDACCLTWPCFRRLWRPLPAHPCSRLDRHVSFDHRYRFQYWDLHSLGR